MSSSETESASLMELDGATATSKSWKRISVMSLAAACMFGLVAFAYGNPWTHAALRGSALHTTELDSYEYRVFAVGQNKNGQLGQGFFSEPITIPVPMKGLDGLKIVDVESSDDTAFMLSSFDVVFGVGQNNEGQLGLGNFQDQALPVRIPGTQNTRQIAGGDDHVVFVDKKGFLSGTGSNDQGQLGPNGFNTDVNRVQTIPGYGAIRFATAGENFNLATIKQNIFKGNGENGDGELGLGKITQDEPRPLRSEPIMVKEKIGSEISSLSAGEDFGMAELDGLAFTWGRNDDGELCNGKKGTDIPTPRKVRNLRLPIVQVEAGSDSSYFLRKDGLVFACGENNRGQLGLGFVSSDDDDVLNPQRVRLPKGKKVLRVAGGENFAYFLLDDHTVWGVGANENGQLGQGDKIDRSTPVKLPLVDVIDVGTTADNSDFGIFLAKAVTRHPTEAPVLLPVPVPPSAPVVVDPPPTVN